MKVNLNGVLELRPDERYEDFQEKLINWISSNGWKAEKVGGIKIPVKLHMKMQAGSGTAIFDTNNKKISNKRYFLSRTWDTNLPIMTAFMMNPSSADESCGDNTVNFMIKVAKYNNYGSLFVINTSPIIKISKTKKEDFINDIENYAYIEYAVGISEVVVLGWGKNGQRYGIQNLKLHQSFQRLMHVNRQKFRVFGYSEMSDGRKYPNHPHPSLKSKQFAVDDDLVVVTEKQWGEIFGETL